MSRSRKKPYGSIVCMGRGAMGKWKRQYNRQLRRSVPTEDAATMKLYKKVINRWDAPDDGRCYWDEPKMRRK